MKKIIYFLFVVFLTVSCTKRNVKLPVNNILGIQDTIYNNSKIWFFYELKKQDTIANFNKNNSVANTHIIFNIDKRLKLKQLLEGINKIQLKKEKPSMHSNGEYMHSYLSYLDSSSNKLSMVLFDSIRFLSVNDFYPENLKVIVNHSSESIKINEKMITLKGLNNELSKYKDSIKRKVYLKINKNILYKDYLDLKATLQNVKVDSLSFSIREYYY